MCFECVAVFKTKGFQQTNVGCTLIEDFHFFVKRVSYRYLVAKFSVPLPIRFEHSVAAAQETDGDM
jgi:hypothetical protein